MNPEQDRSRIFWDQAARRDAMWHIATGAADSRERFFASGVTETDTFLAFADIAPDPRAAVLEIGCGMGRMTSRLADLFGRVVGLDVSEEMLERAREALPDKKNITWLQGNGADLAGVADASVDVVFSYIVLQHVPTVAGQLSYFRETRRVLAPGGAAAIQVRTNTVPARALDWAGHLRHRISGRHTFAKAWRGARLPRTALLAAASGIGVDEGGPVARVQLRPFGSRHTWVIMRRPVGPLPDQGNTPGG